MALQLEETSSTVQVDILDKTYIQLDLASCPLQQLRHLKERKKEPVNPNTMMVLQAAAALAVATSPGKQ